MNVSGRSGSTRPFLGKVTVKPPRSTAAVNDLTSQFLFYFRERKTERIFWSFWMPHTTDAEQMKIVIILLHAVFMWNKLGIVERNKSVKKKPKKLVCPKVVLFFAQTEKMNFLNSKPFQMLDLQAMKFWTWAHSAPSFQLFFAKGPLLAQNTQPWLSRHYGSGYFCCKPTQK